MPIKPFITAFLLFAFVDATFAAAKQPSYESVLPPGARLIAGDLTKNEFFILGKDEPLPASVMARQAPITPVVKPTQLAMNKKISLRAPMLALKKSPSKKPILIAKNKFGVTKALQKAVIQKAGRVIAKNKTLNPRVKIALKETLPKKIRPPMKNAPIYAANKIRKTVIYGKPNKATNKKSLPLVKTVSKKNPYHVVMLNQSKHKIKKAALVKA